MVYSHPLNEKEIPNYGLNIRHGTKIPKKRFVNDVATALTFAEDTFKPIEIEFVNKAIGEHLCVLTAMGNPRNAKADNK